MKIYLSRSISKMASIDMPVGDPFGGPAYGEFKDPTSVATAAVGPIVGGIMGSDASSNAADVQSTAANKAADQQMQMFNKVNEYLAPYRSLGTGSIPSLLQAMGYTPQFDSAGNLTGTTRDMSSPLNQQFNFNPGDLTKYPGYEFTLAQGLRGIDQSAAARGLGKSAADIRGAADYATGLAQNTFGNAYNQALNTYQTNYNTAANNAARIAGLTQVGQNSAAQTGSAGLNAAMNAGNFATSAAAAQAAGQIGSANALTGAIGQGMNYNLQNQYVNAIKQANQNAQNNAGYSNTMPNGGWSDNPSGPGTMGSYDQNTIWNLNGAGGGV